MKRASALGLFVIVLSMAFSSSIFALGYRNPSVEPRADGMANAVMVDTKSPSVIFFNPGGLSYLEGVDMAMGLDLVAPSVNHKGSGGVVTDTNDTLYAMPSLYIGYKPKDKNFAFGLAINNPYGLGINWGSTSFAKFDVVKASLNMFNIQPTVSFLFSKYVSLGFGINLYAGRLDLKNKTDLGQVMGLGVLTGKEFDVHFKGTGFEQTMNIGLIIKPVDRITLGASYRTGKNMVFDGNLTLTNIPPEMGLGTDTVTYKAKSMMIIPAIVTWGAAWDILDTLKVEFDVDWTKWSSFVNQSLAVIDNPALSQTFSRRWQDSYMYSVGGEWWAKSWGCIRMGYTFADNSIPLQTLEAAIPDTQRHVIAVGFGFKYKKYTINLAYNAVISQAISVNNDYLSPYADLNGTYDAISHIVGLGLEYKF